jgi:hypothetical protein
VSSEAARSRVRRRAGDNPDAHDHPDGAIARNARLEAQAVVGEEFDARILEPSPPAVMDGEWFADDPVRAGTAFGGRRVVSPVSGADLMWDEWLGDRPEHRSWARARWLGAFGRLPSPPTGLPEARLALHRLALYVVSPARRRANGKIGLRWTLGGIGTPFFGADEQVRVAGAQLVRQKGDVAIAEPVATLRSGAAFALGGPPDSVWAESFDAPPPGCIDDELAADTEAGAFLGDWFGFAFSVLEELRSDPASIEANRVQLWPEHFDASFDCLPGDRRSGFGASPGDAAVGEPYLYVVPSHIDRVLAGDVWNSCGFSGAVLPLSDFVAASDQRGAALSFFRECRTALEA